MSQQSEVAVQGLVLFTEIAFVQKWRRPSQTVRRFLRSEPHLSTVTEEPLPLARSALAASGSRPQALVHTGPQEDCLRHPLCTIQRAQACRSHPLARVQLSLCTLVIDKNGLLSHADRLEKAGRAVSIVQVFELLLKLFHRCPTANAAG